jgi:hypothetical protein
VRPASERLAWVTACGVVAALAVAVAWSGLRLPWWVYADPDGAYTGSAVNILLGNHTQYLDHPGLPTQDALAVGYGTWYLVEKAVGDVDSRQAFADEILGDLDSSRWLYRAWAMLLYAGGAALVVVVVGRFLGHWTWGAAGGLMYLATPGLAEIGPMLRPDSGLAALCTVVACLVAAGFDRRHALAYLGAAWVFGLALTFKISALGLAIPIVVAALWRPPAPGWAPAVRAAVGDFVRRYRWPLLLAAAAWIVICVIFNRERLPIFTNDDQRTAAWTAVALLAGFAVCTVISSRLRIPLADRLFSTFNATLLCTFAAGVALPMSMILDDGLQALVAAAETVSGGRVNASVEPFADFDAGAFLRFPLSAATVLFALATIGVVRGVRERVWWPLLLATGIVPLLIVAAARYSFSYYYAPAYAAAIPVALWGVRDRRAHASVAAWIAAVVLAGQLPFHLSALGDVVPSNEAAHQLADEILRPAEVILVSPDVPVEDILYSKVEGFADYAPALPYRFASEWDLRRALDDGLSARYYVARTEDLPQVRGEAVEWTIGDDGPFVIRRLERDWGPENRYGIAEILELPGES